MKSNSIKVYDLAVILMTIKVMLDRVIYLNAIKFLDNILIVISLFLFVLVIVVENKYSIKEWIIIGATGVLCLYSSLQMKEYFLILSYFLIVASINKNIRHTIKMMRNIKMIFIVISIIWYIFAYFITQDTIFTVIKNGKIAHHFGFTHPNAFALIICWIMLEILYLNIKNLKKIYLLVYVVVGLLLYWMTSCDTAMYILILAAVLRLGSYYTVIEKIQTKIAKFIFPMLGIMNFACIYIYAQRGGILYNFVSFLDIFLTARIRQAAQISSMYGFTLFGHYIPIGHNVPYDSYYRISLLVCDGLFSYFLVCIGFIYTIIISILIWKYVKRNSEYSIIVILFSCYCILEVHGLNVYMAYPLLLFGCDYLNSLRKRSIRNKKGKRYYD